MHSRAREISVSCAREDLDLDDPSGTVRMIRHVVALQLAATDSEVRRRHAEEIKARLEALADVDPGITDIAVHFDLGLVESHWPLVLVADYVDNDALEAYQAHPRHGNVLAWMNDGVVSGRAVVDYALD